MLFVYFVLPVLFALLISGVYIRRIAHRKADRYPWLFRSFYGLTILAGALIAVVRFGGALDLGWTFADPWLLMAAFTWTFILLIAVKDWFRPIHSIYMGYMVPVLAVVVAGLCAVKPDGKATAGVFSALILILLWVIAIRFILGKAHGFQRWLGVAGLHLLFVASLIGWLTYAQQQSVLPGSFTMNMTSDAMAAQPGVPMQEVTDLRGPEKADSVAHFDLEATATTLKLASGETNNAWVYRTAGATSMPVLRVRQGDLVEATLTNHLPVPVTIHWHGVNVPNGEDGVAGITQDAIKPGKKFTYRFIAKDAGTYWFHSHQDSNVQVAKGLFGALIVEPPPDASLAGTDIVALAHTWQSPDRRRQFAFSGNDAIEKRAVAPGTPVRIRLINTDNDPQDFQLLGTSYHVMALDGVNVAGGQDIADRVITVPSGGRVDLGFTMPSKAVELAYNGELKRSQASILMSPNGQGEFIAPKPGLPAFNMDTYGQPQPDAITAGAHFDKTYSLTLDDSFRFYNGQLQFTFPINGKLLPDTPMLVVHEGDIVKVSFKNRSADTHPMHLHGHHFTVLSHNGKAVTSRLLLDTINVKPGESWAIAFKADNPGMWMSHCHNLWHAASGMDLMVAYDTVMTPFSIQVDGGNKPE